MMSIPMRQQAAITSSIRHRRIRYLSPRNGRKESKMSPCPIEELRTIFLGRGLALCSDTTTHIDHAVQCAMLAERDGAPAWLVTAASTHDIGHLLAGEQSAGDECTLEDRHDSVGATWLRTRFDPRVAIVAGAHVAAKRYLCATQPGYMRSLPLACQRTLVRQGGPMCSAEVNQFDASTLAHDALRLRRWDQRAHDRAIEGSRLEHFLSIARLALPTAARR